MQFGSSLTGYGPCSVNIMQKIQYMILAFILDNQLDNAKTVNSILFKLHLSEICPKLRTLST